jgi:LTXXQ motif family protein
MHHRIAATGMALVLVIVLADAAQARHRGRYWYFNRAATEFNINAAPQQMGVSAESMRERRSGGQLSAARVDGVRALVEQLLADCEREVRELNSFPEDSISQTVRPDSAQANALREVSSVAAEMAGRLMKSCPNNLSGSSVSRLESLDHEFEAVQVALDRLQPSLQTFYEGLSKEQQARVAAQYDPVTSEPTQVSGRRYARSDAHLSTYARRAAPAIVPKLWNCNQWQAELRAWPVERVEIAVQVAPRQRAAMYGLAASLQHAADVLADTCPQELVTTPIAAIEDVRKRLEALRQSVGLIRPAIEHFYEVLEGGQRSRLSELM